jgi:hypothetical protein
MLVELQTPLSVATLDLGAVISHAVLFALIGRGTLLLMAFYL